MEVDRESIVRYLKGQDEPKSTDEIVDYFFDCSVNPYAEPSKFVKEYNLTRGTIRHLLRDLTHDGVLRTTADSRFEYVRCSDRDSESNGSLWKKLVGVAIPGSSVRSKAGTNPEDIE